MKKAKSILLVLCVIITSCFVPLSGLSLKSKALDPRSYTAESLVIKNKTLYEEIDSKVEKDKSGNEYNLYSIASSDDRLSGDSGYTLTFADGSAFSNLSWLGDDWFMGTKEFTLQTNCRELQEQEHWQVGGTYEVTAEIIETTYPSYYYNFFHDNYNDVPAELLAGPTESVLISTTFFVTIEENPIKSFEISDITVYEGIDKEICEDGNLYNLSLKLSSSPPDSNKNLSLILSDGTYYDYHGAMLNIAGMTCDFRFNTDIDPYEEQWEQWQAGNTYEVTAKICEAFSNNSRTIAETKFNVKVEENPIESIDFQDITLYEDLDGSKETDWETGETYIRYYGFPNVKVTFKDGSQDEFNHFIYYGNSSCMIYNNGDEMQREEHWTAGNTYTVNGSVAGFEGTFNVTIAENPVASIEVSDITLYEGLDSNINTDWETGEKFNYYTGDRLTHAYKYTVYYKDGTKKTPDENGSVEVLPGRYHWLGTTFYEMQHEEHWTVGNTYEVTGYCAGVEAKFNVTIAENPVESLEIADMTLRDKLDGYSYGGWDGEEEFFCFDVNPKDFTVTFKNGTIQKADKYGEIPFDGRYYGLNVDVGDQYEEHWEVGKTYDITGEFAGVTDNFKITIEESYADFTISGKNQLILTFTKKNGQKDIYRALMFDCMGESGDEDFIGFGGYLYTDRKIFNAYFYTSNEGLQLVIGEMESNILPDHPFLDIDYDTENVTLTTAVDTDGDDTVTCDDAVYLIYHIFKPDEYPLSSEQECDFNGDGEFSTDDAIYLLYHIFLPEKYPI